MLSSMRGDGQRARVAASGPNATRPRAALPQGSAGYPTRTCLAPVLYHSTHSRRIGSSLARRLSHRLPAEKPLGFQLSVAASRVLSAAAEGRRRDATVRRSRRGAWAGRDRRSPSRFRRRSAGSCRPSVLRDAPSRGAPPFVATASCRTSDAVASVAGLLFRRRPTRRSGSSQRPRSPSAHAGSPPLPFRQRLVRRTATNRPWR